MFNRNNSTFFQEKKIDLVADLNILFTVYILSEHLFVFSKNAIFSSHIYS